MSKKFTVVLNDETTAFIMGMVKCNGLTQQDYLTDLNYIGVRAEMQEAATPPDKPTPTTGIGDK